MPGRFTPAASRRTRTLIAGLVWSAVGVMLVAWAVSWLAAATPFATLTFGVGGVTLALVAWRMLFRRLAAKNLERLAGLPDRLCVFGFQSPQSYLITVAMIALGVTLRHSALPKPELAVVYLAIGGALFLASMRYHVRFARTLKGV